MNLEEQLRNKENLNILAIETSCDETACAIVRNGREVISNALYTQIDIHKKYGGVVPEIASRNHVEKLPIIVNEAVESSGLTIDDIDMVAVTYGPGLVGALLTGISFAKAYAYALGKPLLPVNHMEGHISANFITHKDLEPPFICMLVSGGNTMLLYVKDYCDYEVLGDTLDDAAGEAFDKVARVLGLEYPGGPNIEKLAKTGNSARYSIPMPLKKEDTLNFSFSGIKTHVINLVRNMESRREEFRKEDVAASFEDVAVEHLLSNVRKASEIKNCRKIVFGGGVSANALLREKAEKYFGDYELYFPKLKYCTDNAAMIASAAYYSFKKGKNFAGLDLNADPGLELIQE